MMLESEIKNDTKKIPILQPSHQDSPARLRVTKPKIDLKKCDKNYNCVVYCPHNAISRDKNGYPVIDYDLCNGCLVCLRECPTFAIGEEKENTEIKV